MLHISNVRRICLPTYPQGKWNPPYCRKIIASIFFFFYRFPIKKVLRETAKKASHTAKSVKFSSPPWNPYCYTNTSLIFALSTKTRSDNTQAYPSVANRSEILIVTKLLRITIAKILQLQHGYTASTSGLPIVFHSVITRWLKLLLTLLLYCVSVVRCCKS